MSNWLTYSPISGHGNGTITITADTLSSLEDRVATIIASNSQYSLSASTSVTQKGAQPTAITFENVTWVTDIPASGGTATKNNCNFKIYAIYGDGTELEITDLANVTGSLIVPPTTSTVRRKVGVLELFVDYGGVTASTEVDAYQESAVDWSNEYLTFEIISGGTIYWVCTGTPQSFSRTIEYRINNGNWQSISSNTGFSINSGSKVQFRGNNDYYAVSNAENHFSTDCTFNVCGNIMSLINKTNFDRLTTLPSEYTFTGLFQKCNGLISAASLVLPATALTPYCYENMFVSCRSLTTAPELPATILAYSCYFNMFYNCSSLTTAPELPATTLAPYCYGGMFINCYSLNTVQFNYLPATILADWCYYDMFGSCTGLTTAPVLPATTMKEGCYCYMFSYCRSLETAPVLSAATLAKRSYQAMFIGCTSLNYIKCLATNISAESCTDGWVDGVSSTGTFIKNPNMSSWTTGENGIPSGWTVIDAT